MKDNIRNLNIITAIVFSVWTLSVSVFYYLFISYENEKILDLALNEARLISGEERKEYNEVYRLIDENGFLYLRYARSYMDDEDNFIKGKELRVGLEQYQEIKEKTVLTYSIYLFSIIALSIIISIISYRYIKKLLVDSRRTEIALHREKLYAQNLANYDSLTGILNRRSFETSFQREFKMSYRNNRELSILMVDIDFFKSFNDTYGHLYGDEIIIKTANILKEVFNRPGDLIARFGGEEFSIVLPETDIEGAKVIAQRASARIKKEGIEHPKGGFMTVSIGISTCKPCVIGKYDHIIDRADKALYSAKNSGRNRICIYPNSEACVDCKYSKDEIICL